MNALRPFRSTPTLPDFPPFRSALDRLFEDWWNGEQELLEPFKTGAWRPRIDMSETDGEIVITAEMPGMEEKNVEVELVENGLRIHGEKTGEKEEKKKSYYFRERHYGAFERFLTLPAEVDDKKVKAGFKDGVLTVTLPKTQKAKEKTRKIRVEAV